AGHAARVAALARRARLGVAVDSAEGVRALGEAARRATVEVLVLVDVDVGLGRCGVAGPAAGGGAVVAGGSGGARRARARGGAHARAAAGGDHGLRGPAARRPPGPRGDD